MKRDVRKLYLHPSWKLRCQQIFEADSNTCCDCGRKPPEVILQVHHLRYEKGKKPWEYNRSDLVTLCKGCHARRHKLIEERPPSEGWEYVDSDDLGELCGVCEYCGTEIRYEHYIYHSDYGYMSVGCQCSDRLTSTKIASKKDKKMKLAERRLQTYINSSQWKKHKNCYFYPKLEGFKIMIVETEYGYYITLFYNYLQDNQPQQAKKHSNTKYENLIEAKKQIYYAITTGEMRKYLRKNGEPCPNDVLYNTDDDDIFDY